MGKIVDMMIFPNTVKELGKRPFDVYRKNLLTDRNYKNNIKHNSYIYFFNLNPY